MILYKKINKTFLIIPVAHGETISAFLYNNALLSPNGTNLASNLVLQLGNNF